MGGDCAAMAEWLSTGGGILRELPAYDGISARMRHDVRMYEEALQAYQEARFPAARDILQALHAASPGDMPTKKLLERTCRYIGADGYSLVNMTSAERASWK